MNSHQRRKNRKKQEIERRTTGKKFTTEDRKVHHQFFNVVRKLMGMHSRNYDRLYWGDGVSK